MAHGQNGFGGLYVGKSQSRVLHEGGWRLAAPGVRISINRAPWRSLSSVELPVSVALLVIFSISILVSPALRTRAFGVDLPALYQCPLYLITGIPCPFGGMTRSFMAMGGLDVGGAFIFNPLGPALFVSLSGLTLIVAMLMAFRRRIRISLDSTLRRTLILLGSGILLVAWVVKLVVWSQVGLL